MHKEGGDNMSKTTRTAICLIALAICVFLVISVVSSRVNIKDRLDEIEQTKDAIQEKVDSNAALEDMLNSNDINDYVGEVARDKLGYGLNSEKVYVNITGK